MTLINKINDCKLATSKNAKLFYDTHKCLYYAVHYNHVILTVSNSPVQVLNIYCASPTSQTIINDVIDFLDIPKIGTDIDDQSLITIEEIYQSLGKTIEDKKSDYQDYKGGYTKDKFTKKDWLDRIKALENYDYKKGSNLYNGESN